MNEKKLRSLLSLLDDPDESIAVRVMTELLEYEPELLDLLGDMQESADPVLRKRIQQLESILLLRRRRKDFLQYLNGENPDILQGLTELHLLWFDRDTPEMLMENLQIFLSASANSRIKTLGDLGLFMARSNFVPPPPDEELDPENYCIGPILEDRIGSEVILCALALLAGICNNLNLWMLRIGRNFVLMNEAGERIAPANDWQLEAADTSLHGEFWNEPAMVLRYAAQMLFLAAVSTDNFRYVHTVAHAMLGSPGDEKLDFLPYPYNGNCADKSEK